MSKRAERSIVTGANGQDGSYLVERLLSLGDEVHGMCHTDAGVAALVAASPGARAHVVDLGDTEAVASFVSEGAPTRIFNLGGITSVARSWDAPVESIDVLGLGPVRLLEAIRSAEAAGGGQIRMLQASSAEIFGDAAEVPQSELTVRAPVSPYGIAKHLADQMVASSRARGMHVSSAILYNHESPRRPETFVSKKIARAVVQISRGVQDSLTLGDIDAERDWGYAPDYVDAMMRIIEQDAPSEYIVATGELHSVREFVELAFLEVGIIDWAAHVIIDRSLFRPVDPSRLVGDAGRLRALGWSPSLEFPELVRLLVEAERDTLAVGEPRT